MSTTQTKSASRSKNVKGNTAVKNTISKSKVRPRGRPFVVEWGAFHAMWRNHTDVEMARLVGCSQPNVSIRRKKLIAAAEAKAKLEGRDPAKAAAYYTCKHAKWSRRPVEA